MKREIRIPTLLGLFIIIASLTFTIILFANVKNLLTQASQDVTPNEVKITNVSDRGFTVSWVTAGNINGVVNYGENISLGSIAADDRDQISGKTGQYSTHHVTLRYLKPANKYYFKVLSGNKDFDNNGQPYVVTTAPTITGTPSIVSPIYGSVQKNDGTPADGAIVYVNLVGTAPLSTLVKTSGNWLITLSNARTADLSNFAKFSGTEKIDIFVRGRGNDNTEAKVTAGETSPVAQLTLGKIYNPQTRVDLSPTPTSTPSSRGGFELPATASSSPSLTKPAINSTIPSDQPIFAGTGIPGKTVMIKVESTTPLNGTTTVDQNGNWSWTPPTGLAPGEHTVTVTTTDSAGNPLAFNRQFTVFASGTQVSEPATPSATLKPSPTPSITPTPRPAPSSTAPTSGNATPSILITILAVFFITLGLGRLMLLDNR